MTPDGAVILLLANGLVMGAAIMVGGVGFQSIMADTADEHEYPFGVRREGLFFSGLGPGLQGGIGFGGLIAGVALDLIRFPTDIASRPDLAIPADILTKLALASGPLPALIAFIAALFLFGDGLTRTRHAEIIAALQRRKSGESLEVDAVRQSRWPLVRYWETSYDQT